MKVLLTGPFGNAGESTVKAILEKGYTLRCFDKKTRHTKKIQQKLLKIGDFETIWGDLTNSSFPEMVGKMIQDIDCIIHLAACISPEALEKPDYAYQVNVEGTRKLINAIEKLQIQPKFIMAGSLAIYGSTIGQNPPRKVTDEPNPLKDDYYSFQKWEMEKILKASKVENWSILRVGVIPSFYLPMNIPPIMFEVPLDQRIEIIHTYDAGLAFTNAVKADINKKIMHICGGEKCRMLQRDYVSKTFASMGIKMLPEHLFKVPKDDTDWFHTDWLDTEESQSILNYQRHTLEDFLQEFRKRTVAKRILIAIFKPLVRLILELNPVQN